MTNASLRHRHPSQTKQTEDDDYEAFVEQCNTAMLLNKQQQQQQLQQSSASAGLSSSKSSSQASSSPYTMLLIFFTGIIIILITITATSTGTATTGSTTTIRSTTSLEQDLKLITIYPRSLSHTQIHDYSTRHTTELLLVTDDNRKEVNAIRTSIGMNHNLKYYSRAGNRYYRNRKGGIMGFILMISNAIAGLVGSMGSFSDENDSRRDYVRGEVVLESFDTIGMRGYLFEHGVRCLNNNDTNTINGSSEKDDITAGITQTNLVLQRYDELTSLMDEYTQDREMMDSLWNQSTQLWMWCMFANGDARGYVEHGIKINQQPPPHQQPSTTLSSSSLPSLQELLEDARLVGNGIAVVTKQTVGEKDSGDQRMNIAPLFVLPADKGGTTTPAATFMSREILNAYINTMTTAKLPLESIPYNNPSSVLGNMDGDLKKWITSRERNPMVQLSDETKGAGSDTFMNEDLVVDEWLFLESLVKNNSRESLLSFRWLAKYCPDKQSNYKPEDLTLCRFLIDPRYMKPS